MTQQRRLPDPTDDIACGLGDPSDGLHDPCLKEFTGTLLSAVLCGCFKAVSFVTNFSLTGPQERCFVLLRNFA